MQESISHKKIFAAMFSFFFIGCAAAILGIYRAAKNTERPLGYVMEEHDGNIFV
jgi:phosphotransferase system  glucose/maltose/N-acetylglucosamine-specific IIC component